MDNSSFFKIPSISLYQGFLTAFNIKYLIKDAKFFFFTWLQSWTMFINSPYMKMKSWTSVCSLLPCRLGLFCLLIYKKKLFHQTTAVREQLHDGEGPSCSWCQGKIPLCKHHRGKYLKCSCLRLKSIYNFPTTKCT